MFFIDLKPTAAVQLKQIKRFYTMKIITAIEKYLRQNPDKPAPPRIKKLRGKQKTTFRLREGDYRIFYDILGTKVVISAILHKSETEKFYNMEELIQ